MNLWLVHLSLGQHEAVSGGGYVLRLIKWTVPGGKGVDCTPSDEELSIGSFGR